MTYRPDSPSWDSPLFETVGPEASIVGPTIPSGKHPSRLRTLVNRALTEREYLATLHSREEVLGEPSVDAVHIVST